MKTFGMWVLLVLCVAVVAYVVYLVMADAPRRVDAQQFQVYPWQQGSLWGYWVLVATLGSGMLVIPCIRTIVRVTKSLKIKGVKAAAAEASMAADEATRQGGQHEDR